MGAMSSRGGFVGLCLFALVVLFGLMLLQNARPPTVPHPNRFAPTPVNQAEEPVDEELVVQLEQELPEVDYAFWYYFAQPLRYGHNSSCAPYPNPLDLQLHNVYWQTFVNLNVTFRLFAAYLDERKSLAVPTLRILATANQLGDQFPPTHCQLWYQGHRQPIFVQVTEFLSVWMPSWGQKPLLSYPHLISCPLPRDRLAYTPRTVSLVAQCCDKATNSLRVNHQKSNSNSTMSIGVCVKAFDFPFVDLTPRLIEWFELQRLLGASRIYAYLYDVHPAVQRVLNYYQSIGYLELRPLTLADGMPHLRHYQHLLLQQQLLVKRLNELISYNDCFYRHMYQHDYLLNVDVDEVMLPLANYRNWQQVLQRSIEHLAEQGVKCPQGYVALCFINSYFTRVVPPDEKPSQLYVLQHTLRHRNYSLPGRATKCFHNTRYSLTLHNHFTIEWLDDACLPKTVSIEYAQMQHYREPDDKYELADLVKDRSIWKFSSELQTAVEHVWTQLNDRGNS